MNWFEDNKGFHEAMTHRQTPPARWDEFFMGVAKQVADMSKCASRHCGSVIVRDQRILSTGFNGAPTGSSLCQFPGEVNRVFCPRVHVKSGEGVELCPAQHAERNAITNAARQGVSTEGATIYIWAGVTSCQQCAGAIINAGIKEIVFSSENWYDPLAKLLLEEQPNIVVRTVPL